MTHLLARLLARVRPYLAQIVVATVLLLVSGALMGAVVATVKPLVEELLNASAQQAAPREEKGDSPFPRISDWIPTERIGDWARDHAYVEVPLLIVLAYFLRALFGYFGQYLLVRVGANTIRDLRLELYGSVAHQSPGFFLEHPTGMILSRILNDIAMLQRVFTTSLAGGLRVVAMVPALLFVAFYYDWRMSLVALVALPLLAYPMVALGKQLRRAGTAAQEGMASVAHKVNESVSGVRVVQGFGMESFEVSRFGEALNRMLRAELRAGRTASLASALVELVGAMIGAAMLYGAGMYIARGEMSGGNFAAVLACLGLLFASMRRLNQFYAELQVALSAAERVFDMLDREREIVDASDARPLPPFRREIRFDHVYFSYGDENVLSDIDMTIGQGQVIAMVGASGAGKTTLANLLPRFYDPTRGAIRFDGTDIRKATLLSLRSQIGIVTQETVLFDDTARNNIAYGREGHPLERIIEVARATQCHEFIERLPQGYDTVLGERGARLSMGQRQRITIARALLKDPPLLILDEATSALDTESESLVQQALEVLMRGRTSLVIAHRLSTVRRADRIVVLEEGRIVEQGTHDELLRHRGAYARFHDLQFRTPAAS